MIITHTIREYRIISTRIMRQKFYREKIQPDESEAYENVPQLTSSLLSPQSSLKSHRYSFFVQLPRVQVNCSFLQAFSEILGNWQLVKSRSSMAMSPL